MNRVIQTSSFSKFVIHNIALKLQTECSYYRFLGFSEGWKKGETKRCLVVIRSINLILHSQFQEDPVMLGSI